MDAAGLASFPDFQSTVAKASWAAKGRSAPLVEESGLNPVVEGHSKAPEGQQGQPAGEERV